MKCKFYSDVWLIVAAIFVCTGASLAANPSPPQFIVQERTVTGKVVSADGESLPGVNVLIKGQTAGTVTDADGHYAISVSGADATLVFSYIGYSQEEVMVGNQTTIDISLTPSLEMLSEVVVIGYGVVKKSDLTGSVSSVKADELKAVPTTSFDQALQGRAAGVQVMQTSGQPGAEASIRIRGVSSILAGNEPLYVIDGMLVNSSSGDVTAGGSGGGGTSSPRIGPLAAINPSDIESIEILKDASATAIYGSRGTNGVVIVTTKKGKRGTNAVNFETYYAVQEVSKKIDVLNAQQFAEFKNEANINSGQAPIYANPTNLGRGTDWQDEIFRVAPMKNYQLSFSGGDDKTQYLISGGLFDQEGIMVNSDFKRYSFRANLNRKMSEKFSVGTNLAFATTQGNTLSTGLQLFSSPGVVGAALGMNPIQPVYDANVSGGYTFESTLGNPIGNPVAEAKERVSYSTSSRLVGNVEARYKLLPTLEFKTTLGVDGVFSRDRIFAPRWLKSGQGALGEAGVATVEALTWLNENTLTFDKQLNENSSINALAGFTVQEFENERLSAYVFDIEDDRTGYHNLRAGANPQAPMNGEMRWSMVSYLGRVQYSLKDKYLFTVTGRVDASSKFAKNNKYAFFPSGAFAWRISDEAFMQDVKTISDLKLRASIGIIGNQAIVPYQSLALVAPYGEGVFNNGSDGTNYYSSSQPTGYSNPDLKWETTQQFDIGIDAGFFEDRLRVTADYYMKRTNDLLLSTPIASTSGFTETIRNIGNLENRGFDLEISSINTTGELKWNTTVNFSTNRNQITRLVGGTDVLLGNGLMLREGQPIGTFYGYQFQGIFQSDEAAFNSAVFADQKNIEAKKARAGDRQYHDVVEDGEINDRDRTIIGQALPDFTWGMNNSFTYKRFNFSFFIQGSQGNDMMNLNNYVLEDFRGVQNVSAEAALNRWTPTNPSNKYPRALTSGSVDSNLLSSAFIEDASYVRLKNVTLGYELPTALLERVRVKSLRLYASATNLFTITDYSGYDPEGSSYGTTTAYPGVDQGRYPMAKTYLVGLNLGF